MKFNVMVANKGHHQYAESICKMMEEAAKVRGTGIAKRDPEYIRNKMTEGKAVIALNDNLAVGFCYIESWENKKYVANSGLIIHPDYRKTGLAKATKQATFELSKKKFPEATLFGITTSLAVMKINSDLGYKPVTFSELTQDEAFWKGCQNCVNHDILKRTQNKMCLCTGMACDLKNVSLITSDYAKRKSWENFKRFLLLRKRKLQRKMNQYSLLKPVK